MKPDKFLENIVIEYRKARIPIVKNKKINRGRSRSISSISEDLFANYLISNDKKIDQIYVDQSIYIKKLQKAIYPDIVIVRNNTITSLLDLKMDLGWNRKGLVDLCKKHGRTVKKARGTVCKISERATENSTELQISETINYGIVIISKRNSGSALNEQIMEAKEIQPDINVYLLCRNDRKHPNDYDKKISPKKLVKLLDPDIDSFNLIFRNLQ